MAAKITTIMTRTKSSRSNNMKRGLIVLADGFEDAEALVTRDILLRSEKMDVVTASLTKEKEVVSSHNLHVLLEQSLEELDLASFDFIVLPGGKRGMENLKNSKILCKTVLDFHKQGKLVAAICASPSIFGALGILDNKKYTCFPGFQEGKGDYLNVPVVKDGNVITAHSMSYSELFAEEIVRYYFGEEANRLIRKGTRG